VASRLTPVLGGLTGRGGVCLLCYSALLTRGLDAAKADVALDSGLSPLVSGPHALCGTELVNLLLTGRARANVSAYGASGAKVDWRAPSPVGMLSRDEIESGMPLADELKSPTSPVYVVHGGDHFTVAWIPSSPEARFQHRVKALFAAAVAGGAAPNDAAASALSAAAAEAKGAPGAPPCPAGAVDVVLWNGLPPNRRVGWVRLRGVDALAPAPPAPPAHKPSHWRLCVGELESIVQADADDKRRAPGAFKEHKYELSLVTPTVAAEDDASEARPSTEPPPVTFEQGAPPPAGASWRCASCYNTRFKTMCFGENAAPSSPTCKFCGQSQASAGWTIWKGYAELPPSVQRRVERSSGPKVLSVLRTRWPDAAISAVRPPDGAEAEVGTGACASFTLPAV
jgi:hypothetical protein